MYIVTTNAPGDGRTLYVERLASGKLRRISDPTQATLFTDKEIDNVLKTLHRITSGQEFHKEECHRPPNTEMDSHGHDHDYIADSDDYIDNNDLREWIDYAQSRRWGY